MLLQKLLFNTQRFDTCVVSFLVHFHSFQQQQLYYSYFPKKQITIKEMKF